MSDRSGSAAGAAQGRERAARFALPFALRRTLTIWGKELLDTLRDRRTLIVMVVVPVLLMPVFTLLPLILMGGSIRQGRSASLTVDVHGAANGPELVAFLRQNGVEIRDVPGDPLAWLQADHSRAVVVIPPAMSAQMAAEKSVPIAVIADDSNVRSSVVAGRVRELINQFGQQVARRRLESRGLDPAILAPVRVERRNVASQEQMGSSLLSLFLPMVLVLFAFLGGMYTAIDVTAGEKERGTLEPLLAAPVGRAELVLGKLLTVFVTSFGAVVLVVLSTFLAHQVAPRSLLATGLSLALPPGKTVWLLVAALPLTLLLNGLEMLICISARSFKEAQNYVTPMQFALMAPALVVGLAPGLSLPAWCYAVPVVGQMAMFRDILASPTLDGSRVALNLASAGLYAALIIALAVRAFQRESVLFRT